MDEREFLHGLKRWNVEPPPEILAKRIAAHVTEQAQHVPLAWRLTAAFSDWQSELAYKAAALALFALIGFGSGYLQQQETAVDISALAFSDADFSGEIL